MRASRSCTLTRLGGGGGGLDLPIESQALMGFAPSNALDRTGSELTMGGNFTIVREGSYTVK